MSTDYNPNHIEEKVFAQVGVKAIVLNGEHKILLLKRSDKMRRSAGKWSLPGGGINPFENPKDTVAREIREETGIEVTDIHPFETMGHEYEGDSVVLIGYICKAVGIEIVLNWEHSEYAWVTKEEALRMDMSGIKFFIEKLPE